MVKFKTAKAHMIVSCKAVPEPWKVLGFSGDRIQLQLQPAEGGRQYILYPTTFLKDTEFDAAGYVVNKD